MACYYLHFGEARGECPDYAHCHARAYGEPDPCHTERFGQPEHKHADTLAPRTIGYTAFECERDMRRLTNGERGCANPEEHRS